MVRLFKPELIDDISFLFSLAFVELFQVFHVLFFGGLKGVTNFKFAFFVTAKVITSDGVEVIFIIAGHLVVALFMNFGGFDLEGGFEFGGGGSEDGGFFLDLDFSNAEEEVDN